MMNTATVDQFAAARDRGELVIDVRTASEYEQGHVPGAKFMPLFVVPLRISEIDRRRPVYVVCESGARGMQASQYLNERGYSVFNLDGGMSAWRGAGMSISTGAERIEAW